MPLHLPSQQQENKTRVLFAEVALPLRLSQTLTYKLDSEMAAEAQVGARIVVPLGKSKKLTGYIVALHSELGADSGISETDIKFADELLDPSPMLTPEVIELSRWVSDYYLAPWGEVLKGALPAGLNSTIDQVAALSENGIIALSDPGAAGLDAATSALLGMLHERETPRKEIETILGKRRAATLLKRAIDAGLVHMAYRSGGVTAGPKLRKVVSELKPTAPLKEIELPNAQMRALEALRSFGTTMPLAELTSRAETNISTIRALEKKGIVSITDQEVRRDPLANVSLPDIPELPLTPNQGEALTEINAAISERSYHAFLLHGVTGSGKTEIYIRAMREAIKQNKSAMMLVPEISLTPVFSRRLRAHFGDKVAIFHSKLTPGERFDEWTRLKRGEARIVIGTRSAVFAPVSNLGVIVVDEEHDTSYRQHESPFYNGRDTAIVRAAKEAAVVVLGSATPSLESYFNAKSGKYRYLRLPSRIHGRSMASAEIVDMRLGTAKSGKPQVFSAELLKAIEETHARGEQSIVLLNRRGYSSFVLCRSCGESIQCPNCDVTLTYHRSEACLICHYCDYRRPAPSKCPSCQGLYIYFVGEGTEKLEELLHKQFPDLRIARVDRDTTSRRRAFEETLMRFSAGEIDMLVGTQMLAKGHDFPNVTLVGVVSVDAGLALPDFRSAERTFQLITQVAGRAGRGDLDGKVIIQTFHPNHYALQYACAQDYEGFYEEEIRHRRNLNYPPFVALASLLIRHTSLSEAQSLALTVRESLDAANTDRRCRVLGPAPAPLSRLRGEHRLQILIKSTGRQHLRRLIDLGLENASAKSADLRHLNVEIDPVNLL